MHPQRNRSGAHGVSVAGRTWCNDEAANPRRVKGPAFNHPCEGNTGTIQAGPSASTNLNAKQATRREQHPDLVFTSLYHHIADRDHLRECYRLLKGNKAVGVDEVTKAMYAEDLETNLQDLSARLKQMGYRPHPSFG